MAISREDILLDNIKEALALYQRSLIWGTTAALSGGLLTLRLRDPSAPPVPVLTGVLSASVAWVVAQGLYILFGALAYASLKRYVLALEALAPSEEVLQAIQLYPSLATFPGRVFRLGSVLLPLIVTLVAWGFELQRENGGWLLRDASDWIGLVLLVLLLVTPYALILNLLKTVRVWKARA